MYSFNINPIPHPAYVARMAEQLNENSWCYFFSLYSTIGSVSFFLCLFLSVVWRGHECWRTNADNKGKDNLIGLYVLTCDNDGLVNWRFICQECCTVSILPICLKWTLQQSYASQLSDAKNRTDLSSLGPILQHFEHIKVENQLKRPRTVVTHC